MKAFQSSSQKENYDLELFVTQIEIRGTGTGRGSVSSRWRTSQRIVRRLSMGGKIILKTTSRWATCLGGAELNQLVCGIFFTFSMFE